MEILMNFWLAFNIVFGIFSGFNWLMFIFTCFSDRYKFNQNQLGQLLDLITPVSILAYWFSV